jgi:hypothetical protein
VTGKAQADFESSRLDHWHHDQVATMSRVGSESDGNTRRGDGESRAELSCHGKPLSRTGALRLATGGSGHRDRHRL